MHLELGVAEHLGDLDGGQGVKRYFTYLET